MATSRHIIHQQAVEINATDRNSAQPLFLEISRLFNNRAKDVAGYILDKYDRESELIKIDLLEVDIGSVPFPFSEESFVKVYSEKLEEALSLIIKRQLQLTESRAQENDPAAAGRSLLHLLEQFLLTGTIAWWAGKEELKDPVHVFKALQEKEMPLLQEMITRLFPEARVRKRLVYSFAEENIKTVIGIIQPAEKEYIVRYHARVSYLQAENHFIRTDSTGFGKALWLFILDFLADHSGNRFNRKMFVRATLSAIALRFNLRFEELLFFFSEALKEIPETIRRMENLLSLLEEIALEESQKQHAQGFRQTGLNDGMGHTPASPAAEALFFFLLNGFFPVGFQATDGTALNATLIEALRHDPAYVRLFFLKHGKSSLVRKRLRTHFTEASVNTLVRFIQPSGSEVIMSYASFITQFQKKAHFVTTEERLFNNTLWELILADVFSERNAFFQAKSFLLSNLQALAQHYAMDVIRLQAILVQGTVLQETATGDHAGLFFHLAELLSESTVAKQVPEQSALLKDSAMATQDVSPVSIPQKERALPEREDGLPGNIPEKKLALPEILNGRESTAADEHKRFVFQVVLHLLQSGVFPSWAESGSLSVEACFSRMRTAYPNELKSALLYATRNGKIGELFLQRYASLFKTDLNFLSEQEVSLLGMKGTASADIPGKTRSLPHITNMTPLRAPEKELSLSEMLDDMASPAAALHQRFLFHVVLHLLESGVFPSWAESGSLSVATFFSRMRSSYPNELRTAFLYATRNGKAGVAFLQHYAPVFKTDLVFLFEDAFPERLMLFFKELQAFYAMPDLVFAQALLSALAESAGRVPELPVFFSVLLTHIERRQGKEAAKTVAFRAGTFSSLKGSLILQKAFDAAVKEQAYPQIAPGTDYSPLNVQQALVLSFPDGKLPVGNELPDRLIEWIRHYAAYRQLPSGIKPPDALSEQTFVAWVLEFLFRNQPQSLQELLSSGQLSAAEQLVLSELLQRAGRGLQVRYVVEDLSRRQLLAGEPSLTSFDPDSAESWQGLIKNMLEVPAGSKAYATLMTLLRQESSRMRIARYISDQELKQVFETGHQSGLWPWYQHFQEVALVLVSNQFERQHLRKHILAFFLAVFIGKIHVQHTAKELAMHFVRFIGFSSDDILVAIKGKIARPKKIGSAAFSLQAKELMKQLSVAMNQVLVGKRTTEAIEKEIKALENSLYVRLDAQEKKQLQKERYEKQNEQTSDVADLQKGKALAMGEQVYVRNAGMILLHPFIATLFARAGLTKDGVLTGEAAQAKAVQLLQYAVTGTEQEPEYELVLNKLLTGMKPEEVLIDASDVSTEERALVDGMIQAILMQWDKMKNTSPEGFRNSFLMRDGYVFQTEESWVLRVEQRGYDIILQTLPWSFGMIKFSWMTKPLIVEWN